METSNEAPIDDLLRGWRVSIATLLELITQFARANDITSTIERFLAHGQRIEPTSALEVWWALHRAHLDAHRDAR